MRIRYQFRYGVTAVPVIWLYCVCFACGPSSAVKSSSGTGRSTFEAERPYDDPPLTEHELSSTRRDQPEHTVAPPPDPPAAWTETPSRRMVPGYRVQVHSFRDRKTADAAAQRLQQRLADLSGVRIYIEEEPPYYKVRVGDCRTKAEAGKLLRLLRTGKGYADAWIVETRVYP